MSDKIIAPFTPQQVEVLNEGQYIGFSHPYTCGNEDSNCPEHPDKILVATIRGWICPYCDYTQNWAHWDSGNRENLELLKSSFSSFFNIKSVSDVGSESTENKDLPKV